MFSLLAHFLIFGMIDLWIRHEWTVDQNRLNKAHYKTQLLSKKSGEKKRSRKDCWEKDSKRKEFSTPIEISEEKKRRKTKATRGTKKARPGIQLAGYRESGCLKNKESKKITNLKRNKKSSERVKKVAQRKMKLSDLQNSQQKRVRSLKSQIFST